MRAKDHLSTTRLLALAALVLAAGLLSLRAYDLFGGPTPEPAGSAVERELTYLLEPITGAEKVRVSVTGRNERTVLVMVNGEIARDLRSLRVRIENVLQAAIGFDPETDTLTLTQFPFVRGVGGSLTAMEVAELSGLGLLCALLLVGVIAPVQPRTIAPVRSAPPARDPLVAAPSPLALPEPDMDDDLRAAAQLAEANPNDTAQLVRSWMSYSEE